MGSHIVHELRHHLVTCSDCSDTLFRKICRWFQCMICVCSWYIYGLFWLCKVQTHFHSICRNESIIVCQSWLSADLGFRSVRVVHLQLSAPYYQQSKGICQLILLLTLCACWALADRPTASLFIEITEVDALSQSKVFKRTMFHVTGINQLHMHLVHTESGTAFMFHS